MSAYLGIRSSHFKACPADGVRTEFGVCRGDPIRHIQDLILGDTFLPKRDANWTEVATDGTTHDIFTRARAANLPEERLITLAELIFMSTTGQRLDVFVAVYNGKLFFVSDTPFSSNVEYVLIDINRREDVVVPAIIPTEPFPIAPGGRDRSHAPTPPHLRLIG